MCVILPHMQKVTTAILSIVIATLIVLAGKAIFSKTNHMSATTPDGAVKSFLEMMIPHHEEAVGTAKVIMMDSSITVPEVRLLAARIADAQEFEIVQMEGWYQEWFGTEYVFDPSMYNPMMSDTTKVISDARAKVWLKDMIKHHEHAIDMANETQKLITDLQKKDTTTDGTLSITTTHPGIDTTLLFAEKVKTEQTREIAEMKELLKKL